MKTPITYILSLVVISSILVLVSSPGLKVLAFAGETTMKIEIDKESFLNPDFLFLDIKVESEINSYNSVMSVIDYDPNIIEIENISFDDSFCSITATSSINNLAGKTTIICGNPTANASSTSQIARLKVKKITEDFVKIRLKDSQVISADGLANNILSTTETHNIMIIKEL